MPDPQPRTLQLEGSKKAARTLLLEGSRLAARALDLEGSAKSDRSLAFEGSHLSGRTITLDGSTAGGNILSDRYAGDSLTMDFIDDEFWLNGVQVGTDMSSVGLVYNNNSVPTYYGSTGKLETPHNNLITRSEDMANWAKNECTLTSTIVNGVSCWKFVPNLNKTRSHTIPNPSVNCFVGDTLTIEAKAAGWKCVTIGITNGSGYWALYNFDLTTGLIGGYSQISTPQVYKPEMTDLGDGWYRCSVTVKEESSSYAVMAAREPSHNVIFPAAGEEGDGVNGVYIRKAQVDRGAFGWRKYTATSGSAFYGKARVGYDPATLQKLGLVVESQKTNYAIFSSLNPYSNTLVELTSELDPVVTSPMGGPATRFTKTSSGQGQFSRSTTTQAVQYSCSIWLRAGTTDRADFGFHTGSWQAQTPRIVSGPGAVSVQAGGFCRITGLSQSEWTRVVTTLNAPAPDGVSGTFYVYPGLTSGGAAGESLLAWGMQIEHYNETSYIPTELGVAATRLQDTLTITGTALNAFLNRTNGSFFAEHIPHRRHFSESAGVLELDNSAMLQNTQMILAYSGTLERGQLYKSTIAYAGGAFAAGYRNGATNSAPVQNLQNANRLILGVGAAYYRQDNFIKKVRYWNRRLPNAELQALTQ